MGEGAYPEADRPIAGAVVPPWGFQPRDDATYFPIPWLLSTRGYGVLVDNTETSYFRLGTDVAGRLERGGPRGAAEPAAGRGRPSAVGAVAARVRRPDARGRAAALHRRHRPAARARGAVVLRALGPALG